MDFSNNRAGYGQVRATDMVDYLSHIGHKPQKVRGNDFWYLSPLRDEKTASFKVNRKLNLWYDHGMGKGGNLIDFAILYHQCSARDFLEKIAGTNLPLAPAQRKTGMASDPKIQILHATTLKSEELFLYLKERRIELEVVLQYCHEVSYCFGKGKYQAIGFGNDKGGWEIRNRYFKGSSSPKGVTHLKSGADTLLVFEGFFDFLSYLSMTHKMSIPKQDYLIFNGLAFSSQLQALLDAYESCRLFLDNDSAGLNCAGQLLALDKKIKDESTGYRPHKDLNDFLLACRIKGQSENR